MSKNDYDFYKKIGICPDCRKNSAVPNRVFCDDCAGKRRERYRNSEKKKRVGNKTVQERKKKGICTQCGNWPAAPGRTKCKLCLSKNAEAQRIKRNSYITRSERPSYGMCYICGNKGLHDGTSLCEECYERASRNITRPKKYNYICVYQRRSKKDGYKQKSGNAPGETSTGKTYTG